MGYYAERDIERANAVERRLPLDEADIDLQTAAARLGGEIDGSYIRCPGPNCDPDDRSLYVKFNNGSPYIYECDGNLAKAYAHVRSRLGLAERERRDYTETISRIRAETRIAPGTIVERYLSSRALSLPIPLALRFHRLLKHKPTGSWWPVMVAERSDVFGNVISIHRTYLKHDGSGKAAVEPPRMDLGPTAGTAIRLSPVCLRRARRSDYRRSPKS